MNEKEFIWNAIIERFDESKLEQIEFAKVISESQSTVSYLLSNHRRFKIETLKKILNKVGYIVVCNQCKEDSKELTINIVIDKELNDKYFNKINSLNKGQNNI
ncbi:helix-turn-helix transcriptional regulator [Vibrio chagasii]|uniref:helix-turn-helix domain-containing protein n=1 Tax=Vibrio chagasii TaxID=170679 RepID=UPI0035A610EF